jgi:hypothetical protein
VQSELTATDGQIILMEHAEEHPLLLSVPGMGARLVKYDPTSLCV